MTKNVANRIYNAKPFSNYVDYLNNTIRLPSKYKYTAIDLFAGCGGLSLGFEAAGIMTYGYEMIKDYCDTYRLNMSGRCELVKLTTETELINADIVIGGPPCQPFSVRGKQKGTDDDRNGFPVFIGAIKKIKPKIFMFENVRGNIRYFKRKY